MTIAIHSKSWKLSLNTPEKQDIQFKEKMEKMSCVKRTEFSQNHVVLVATILAMATTQLDIVKDLIYLIGKVTGRRQTHLVNTLNVEEELFPVCVLQVDQKIAMMERLPIHSSVIHKLRLTKSMDTAHTKFKRNLQELLDAQRVRSWSEELLQDLIQSLNSEDTKFSLGLSAVMLLPNHLSND